MTLEEIVKLEGRQPDCSGYVTKYDIECSDGLTIRPGAFSDDDGRKVPLVYMHDHENIDNILGHMYLAAKDDGVYGLGYFNSSPKGQLAKLYVDHGDISSFSIYANKLKKKAKDVVHGMIREVSLVLAGANRGAVIDSPIAHSDDDNDEFDGVICMGDDYGGPIYGNDEPLSSEEYLEHYGRKGMKWGKNLFATEYEAHPREPGKEEETNGSKGPSEEKEKEVRKNAAAKRLNTAVSEWKLKRDLISNDRGDNKEYSSSIERQYQKACSDLVGAIREYVDSYEFTDKEKALFLDELQKRFDSEKTDIDVRRAYKEGVPSIRSAVKKINEEDAKKSLPNTPGMNNKPEKKIPEKVIEEEKIPEKVIEEKKIPEKVIEEKKIPEKVIEEKKIPEKVIEEEKIPDGRYNVGISGEKMSEYYDRFNTGGTDIDREIHDGTDIEEKTAATRWAFEKMGGFEVAQPIEQFDVLLGQAHWYFENERNTARKHGGNYDLPKGLQQVFANIAADCIKGKSYDVAVQTLDELRRSLKRYGFNDLFMSSVVLPEKSTGRKIKEAAEDLKDAVGQKVSEGAKNIKEGAKDALDSLKEGVNKLLNTPILSEERTVTVEDPTSGGKVRETKEEKETISSLNDLFDEAKDKLKSLFKHSGFTDEDAEEIIQHYISGDITMDDILSHADTENGRTAREVFNEMTDEEKSCVYYFMLKARQALEDGTIKHSEEEEDEMKHNVFDDAKKTKEETISHADMEKLQADTFRDAKNKGSLRDAFLAHAEEYGIDNIEFLFPEDRNVTNTPTWIKRPDGWVSKVMRAVGHSPFSRIKSMFADITEPDARARGYIKGNKKVEEVFGLLKRSTSPTTVYKKQKLDRDDIVDITDFDVVTWLKAEMRGMLDEELARAFLIGDGRSPASNDKINEQNIRPIYSDDDLFVIRKAIAVTSSTTTDAKCKEFIRACIKARKDYRGSGNPTLYTTEDMLTDMLLMEDNIGHTLYDSVEKLATKLRVKEIVTVPVFENQSRTVGSATMDLLGIIVNLSDYKVGADKGGSVNMFEDFDIDYNQEKYLIETRCSGALTVPYSAIVIESSSSVYLEVDPDDPTETRYSKSVADLQSDVVVNDDSIGGVLKYVTGYTGYSEDTALQSGNYLSIAIDAPNGATTTVKMVNNGGVNETEETLENDYYVAYVRSKNAKIVVTTTLAGVSVTKTYSLRLLKLEKA